MLSKKDDPIGRECYSRRSRNKLLFSGTSLSCVDGESTHNCQETVRHSPGLDLESVLQQPVRSYCDAKRRSRITVFIFSCISAKIFLAEVHSVHALKTTNSGAKIPITAHFALRWILFIVLSPCLATFRCKAVYTYSERVITLSSIKRLKAIMKLHSKYQAKLSANNFKNSLCECVGHA